MAYVVLIKDGNKKWCSAYGLFKDTESANDYIENNLQRNQLYTYSVDLATDEEMDKAVEIRMRSNRSYIGAELLGIRET